MKDGPINWEIVTRDPRGVQVRFTSFPSAARYNLTFRHGEYEMWSLTHPDWYDGKNDEAHTGRGLALPGSNRADDETAVWIPIEHFAAVTDMVAAYNRQKADADVRERHRRAAAAEDNVDPDEGNKEPHPVKFMVEGGVFRVLPDAAYRMLESYMSKRKRRLPTGDEVAMILSRWTAMEHNKVAGLPPLPDPFGEGPLVVIPELGLTGELVRLPIDLPVVCTLPRMPEAQIKPLTEVLT